MWLARTVGRDLGGNAAKGELAGEVCSGQGGCVEEGVVDDKDGAAVFIGAIEVGDGSGREIPEDVGVIELKPAVIATTHDC